MQSDIHRIGGASTENLRLKPKEAKLNPGSGSVWWGRHSCLPKNTADRNVCPTKLTHYLNPPGISVLRTPTPAEAAAEIRAAYPDATGLHEAAKTIGSSTIEAIRSAGFDVIPMPSRRLPNHCRLIHPGGAAGFSDDNLAGLAEVFTNTTGH